MNLEIIEEGATKLALIQDVQHDPLSGQILHVDFLAVKENELLTASVPVELTGDSEGVKKGGILDQQIHSLEIQCLPKDLPEIIEGDITAVDLGDAFHVHELIIPDGVTASIDGEVVVAMVSLPRVIEGEAEEGSETAEATSAVGDGEADSEADAAES
ncbi:MAG: large subunit ribosomal protein L25 [Verrucomicrobiales bacterium]